MPNIRDLVSRSDAFRIHVRANVAFLQLASSGLYAKDTGVNSFAYVERFLL